MNNMKLKTKYLGREIFKFKEIDSTQKEVWRRIESGNIRNGNLVITEKQTSGIGTHGRIWDTDKSNITFSFSLFPNCNIEKLENFTYEIAKILTEIFKDFYNVKLEIKLPNDLMINSKKVGGILTESKLHGSIVKSLVIGIGINTNRNKFPKDLKQVATSIKNEFDIEIDNMQIITEFCNRLEKYLEKLKIICVVSAKDCAVAVEKIKVRRKI